METRKICPLLSIAEPQVKWLPCKEEKCALWNEQLSCCGLIAQGIIAGTEIAHKEAAVEMAW
jgi:hypothetical protein